MIRSFIKDNHWECDDYNTVLFRLQNRLFYFLKDRVRVPLTWDNTVRRHRHCATMNRNPSTFLRTLKSETREWRKSRNYETRSPKTLTTRENDMQVITICIVGREVWCGRSRPLEESSYIIGAKTLQCQNRSSFHRAVSYVTADFAFRFQSNGHNIP